jgi:ribonucleases P/MRP protein subunit RPP40
VELILPEKLYEIIKDDFLPKVGTPVYSRAILPLQALVEGDFFNEYIKRGKGISFICLLFSKKLTLTIMVGNILMLSEGGVGAKNVYSLREGRIPKPDSRSTY